MLDDDLARVEQRAVASDASVVIQVGRDLVYVSDAGLSSLWAPGAAAPGECPFPGLTAFGPGQAGWFAGRQALTGELLGLLDREPQAGSGRPLLVVGPSGAGKSSLLGAGLVAELGNGRLPGSAAWPCITITPGAQPAQALRAALAARAEVSDGQARAVLIVDQLEEVFTQCPDEGERAEFLSALAGLAAGAAGQAPAALVVLGLRADFYARATEYPVLRAAMGARQLVVGAMTAGEIRQAITEPARAAGLRLADGLVERLLRDLGVTETAAAPASGPEPAGAAAAGAAAGGAAADGATAGGYEAGRLPLLAHALRATWLRRDADQLTIAGYEAAGGIGGAISQTAEDAYRDLDEPGQRAARQLLLALVRIGDAADADGEGTADTRRRVSASSLTTQAADPAAMQAVLARLTAARLLTSGGHSVQITHEVLLQRWDRLRGWIGEDRAGQLVRQDVEEAAGAWDRTGRDASALFGGVRLAAAQAWADGPARAELSHPARDFLAASDRRRRQGTRRRNATIAVLTALTLVLGVLTAYSLVQRNAAVTSRDQAESAALSAASGTALADSSPETAMEFAVLAERLNPGSPQALGALLGAQAQPLLGRLPVAGTTNAQVETVAYRPGGTVIATATDHGRVQLWSAASYRRLAFLTVGPPDFLVTAEAFSPDGRLLAAGVAGGVRLWNVTRPAHPVPVATIRTDTDSAVHKATAIAFSPGGSLIAAADSDGAVLLTSPGGQPVASTTLGGSDPAIHLAFADQGRLVVLGTTTGAIRLWDPARHTLVTIAPGSGPGSAFAVAPDGQTVAVSAGTAQQPSVALWSLAERRVTATLSVAAAAGPVTALAFSPGGAQLAAGTVTGPVEVWNFLASPQLAGTLDGNVSAITGLAFSPAGTMLASSGTDGSVALWRAPGTALGGRPAAISVTAFSPDGHLLAVGAGRTVALYRMPSGRPAGSLSTGGSLVNALAFSGNGRLLAAALFSSPGTVRLWHLPSGRPAGQLQAGQRGPILSIGLSPDGRLLATSGLDDPVVRLWNTTTLSPVAAMNTFIAPAPAQPGTVQLAFSPSGRLIAVAGFDGLTLLYTATSRPALVGIFDNYGFQDYSVAFSPDGRLAAVGSSSGTVFLYAVHPVPSRPSGPFPRDLTAFPDSTKPITGLAFGPGGGTLVAVGADGAIRLFDIRTGALSASVSTGGNILGLSYSRSLGTLVTSSGNQVSLWQTRPGPLAASVCATFKAPVSHSAWTTYFPEFPYNPIC